MTLEAPNYTQVPNVILDSLHELKPSELKCILAITRKTIGWHLAKEKLSITYLMGLTGLSNRAVIEACKSLTARGWIGRHKVPCDRGFTYEYSLKLEPIDTSDKKSPVTKSHELRNVTSDKLSPVTSDKLSSLPVTNCHGSKETLSKETQEKERNPEPDFLFSGDEGNRAGLPPEEDLTDQPPQEPQPSPPVKNLDPVEDQGSAAPPVDLEPWQKVLPDGRIIVDEILKRTILAQQGQQSYPPDLNLLFERGLGSIWKGPRSYHWSDEAIALAQAKKRALKQGESVADAQTFISNLYRDAVQTGLWMKLEQFHDEMKGGQGQSAAAINGGDARALLGKQMRRVGVSAVLPPEWQGKTGLQTWHGLPPGALAEYVQYLATLPDGFYSDRRGAG